MQLTRSTWLSNSVVRRPLVFDHTETQSGRPGVLESQSHGLVCITVGFFGSETAAPAQDHSLSLRRATRVRALKGGKRDYAIGWKRPSESPSLSHRKLVPMGFAGPSVPIQKPIDSHRNNVWMGSRGAATIKQHAPVLHPGSSQLSLPPLNTSTRALETAVVARNSPPLARKHPPLQGSYPSPPPPRRAGTPPACAPSSTASSR